MDGASNGQYARAPKLEDLLALCKSLNHNQVEYVLIGGFALVLHGFVRGTKDIDLLINPSAANVQKIKKAMATLPDNAIALLEDDEIDKYQVVRIADEIVIDLMAKACGLSYKDVKGNIEWKIIDEVKIPVASKTSLIQMKDTLRPSDQMDVAYLKRLIEEEKK